MDEEVECEDGSRVKLLTSKLVVQPSSVAERYFKRHYWKSEAGDEDICVMRHSNGLCVIALSERHAVVAGNDEILRIELRPDVQAPRGKRRRDGTFAQEGTILCTITTSSKQYKVRAVIRGVLLELNAAISQDPSLVRRKNFEEGFIAVLLPKTDATKQVFSTLVSREEYDRCANIKAAD
mmetsp:Transcript_4587/g.13871  ORF Transcript_4587/g.13871 Transcript_4587/m.13871 type:complete len:180 (-) Transcript_4587:1455-1994(-)